MARPISKRLLNDSCSISLNLGDIGSYDYNVIELESVGIIEKTYSHTADNDRGVKNNISYIIAFDVVNSKAPVPFKNPNDWVDLTYEEKSNYWTVMLDDLVTIDGIEYIIRSFKIFKSFNKPHHYEIGVGVDV